VAARLPERWRRALELASRLGYAARGAVYLTVGVLAMLAALDLTPSASGAHEAMALWARWTPGLLLVALLAGCLLAFSIWRGVQSVFDADRHGHSPRALAIRAGQAVSGLAYGALAVSALELLDGFEDIGEADESESARTAAAEILALPHRRYSPCPTAMACWSPRASASSPSASATSSRASARTSPST